MFLFIFDLADVLLSNQTSVEENYKKNNEKVEKKDIKGTLNSWSKITHEEIKDSCDLLSSK